ncbi:hypothetical protein ACLOC1_03025 [Limosilactobacillus mucosae]|nr:hypothetical protein [Limosilactobacillus mucosae]
MIYLAALAIGISIAAAQNVWGGIILVMAKNLSKADNSESHS